MIRILKIELLGFILLAASALMHSAQCLAATPTTPDSLVYTLYFRQGDDLLMKDYRDNELAIDELSKALAGENASRILKINIIGSASPEGGLEFNDDLSLRRAKSVRGYIIWRWGFTNQQAISITRQTDYLSAWIRAVEDDTQVPRRGKVLEILNSDASLQTKWANIQLLSGDASQYMEQHIFPQLRNAVACVVTLKESSESNAPALNKAINAAINKADDKVALTDEVTEKATKISQPPTDTKKVVQDKNSTTSKETKPQKCATDHRLAIKTNLLQGAVAFAPNLGVEMSIGSRSTIELTGALNHWGLNGTSENNKKLAHWVVQTEYRYWLNKSFCGSFFGVHALGGKYNISGHTLPNLFSGGNIMESQYRYDGWMVGAGVSYGYHLRLAKHWGMEFNVGIGVARLKYDKYDCVRCGRKLNTETKTYFGPTKAGISLIYNF